MFFLVANFKCVLSLIYAVTEPQIANGVACNGATDQLGLRQHKKVWLYYAVLLMLFSYHTAFPI